MRVEFSRRATRDLMRIADYIRPANPSAALKVRAAILAAIDTLALFPHVGRAQATGGVRKLVVRNYPYLVYFVVDGARTRSGSSPSATLPASLCIVIVEAGSRSPLGGMP
jgi:plasmid stabilization system protein ParE